LLTEPRTNTPKGLHRLPSGTPSSDSSGVIYRRYLQGAWVRSGASVFMWFFALLGYFTKQIDRYSFTGISFSVLGLILINPLTLGILKRIRQRKFIAAFSLINHGLEVIGYTAIIYFAGGLSRGYLTLMFPALITYVGVMSPRSWPFIVTAFCSLSMSGMVTLAYFQMIPDTRPAVSAIIPYPYPMLDILIMTAGFLVIAFISSYTSGLLRRSWAQNAELRMAGDKLEQARQDLVEKNLALERAMERVQASDRMKSEFLANMSHELRTPLNHIIGFTELVADRAVGPLNATQEEYLNDVLGSSQHLFSLINDILDLSKIEAGKMDLKVSKIAFQTLLENSLVMIKEKALKHRIKLATRFRGLPPAIRADERKVKQILYNLLSNAVKFTPDGGQVVLEARGMDDQGMDDQGIEIVIRDTGIGLKATDLERIFQPFEQGDNSAGRKFQGTGLGLSLTRKMVNLHGGKIWAESPGIGRGSAFYVVLPAQPEPISEPI
jgi:signal transduction histidine kinase